MSNDETHYKVSGMKCDGCIATANNALSRLPGFVEAHFDLAAGTAVVTGQVDPQAVIKALGEAGYPASLQD